jgi:hypothetical protein
MPCAAEKRVRFNGPLIGPTPMLYRHRTIVRTLAHIALELSGGLFIISILA